jgi:predicted ATPase
MPARRYVITGGPGAGKSTLVAALATRGEQTFPEAGRAILRLHTAIDGPAHAARNPRDYAEAMLLWDMRSWAEAERLEGRAFFDRGVADTIGYLRLIGRPVPAHMQRAALAFRCADPVFVAPPWRDIYVTDADRRQHFDEAVMTHDTVRHVYAELGYRLVDLPLAPVEARVAFILANAPA